MKKDSKRLRFVRARVCAGASSTAECALTVCDGRIEAIDRAAGLGTVDVDFGGRLVIPGAMDGHVHFDEPGFTHRETFATGTIAAAAGGVTTVIDMPCTSMPPVTDVASLDRKLKVIAPKASVDFALWAGVRGNDFALDHVRRSLQMLYSYGVRSIKTYLVSGMPTFEDLTRLQLEEVMRIAADIGLTVGVHAEDKRAVLEGVEREMHSGDREGPLAYARSRNAEAEAKGIATCIELAEKTGARVHIVHMACAEGVRLLRAARARGVSVTAETCPHFLAFTIDDFVRMGSLLKTAPVVKSAADRDALWEGVADGTIDMVATDHAPAQWPQEKQTGSIWTDYGGVPGVELLLPFLLSEGVAKGRIDLQRAIELVCAAPARIHGLESRKGGLQPGMDGDFVAIDPEQKWTVQADKLLTRQKYTPFEGMELTGMVMRTFVRGTEVFERSRGMLGAPVGQLVRPDHDSAA
ncbi:MAG: allantoinase AllB [Deltaproteobacteria bacterium]|nr:allantoinase AllB [Deltaproteobacteria bacterium]